ncbi:hypothetical protein CAAN1_10S00364 [[Candida] anglica]|uniref:Nucleoprotein TPR/MLP1 domain-containing protein n=1 Tax=[Candida] anglica TaxID=148631 RepID=A0ABP0EE84_9ASCO
MSEQEHPNDGTPAEPVEEILESTVEPSSIGSEGAEQQQSETSPVVDELTEHPEEAHETHPQPETSSIEVVDPVVEEPVVEAETAKVPSESENGTTHSLEPVIVAPSDAMEEDAQGQIDEDIANQSFHGQQSPTPLQFALTTPSKALPPLKDIETITTPKSFSVARDTEDQSSPVVSAVPKPLGSLVEEETNDEANQYYPAVANVIDDSLINNLSHTLNIHPQQLLSLGVDALETISNKLSECQDLKSELSLARINQEQSVQIQDKKMKILQEKLSKIEESLKETTTNNENLQEKLQQENIDKEKILVERQSLENKLEYITKEQQSNSETIDSTLKERDGEISRLCKSNDSLTKVNVEQSTKLNELAQELNSARNDKFSIQLQFNKITNELSYTKTQKKWFEAELKSIQERYTDLIKKHETEYVTTNSRLSRSEAQRGALEKLSTEQKEEIGTLQHNLDEVRQKLVKLESNHDVEQRKLSSDLKVKQDLLELTQVQSEERNERINQLETYIEEIKTKLGGSVDELTTSLQRKSEEVEILQEKLKRTEAVLDEELRKETELPKLSVSAESLAAKNPNGMSLSALYSEFSHLKKQLVLERSQKEKLAHQLETFVVELEAKKPAISSYRDQIKFYEGSLKDAFSQVEQIRLEKIDSEKYANKLESRGSALESELVSMKKLCKDLGKQLCYYLIHSKIRDSQEEPLTVTERKAIENILAQSGNTGNETESDTDQLITDRLVGFSNVIELQQKNQELLTVVRQLGKQLESKDAEFSRGIESVAVDEAKEAILTLQGELETVTAKLEAIEKERDAFKAIGEKNNHNGFASNGGGHLDYLTEVNKDLKAQLADAETSMKKLRNQTETTVQNLNTKLRDAVEGKNSLSLKVSTLQHTISLNETRYSNLETNLETSRKEIARISSDSEFWKSQSSKQEKALIDITTQLRTSEATVSSLKVQINNLETARSIWQSVEKNLETELEQAKTDKNQLSEFVTNLQALIKERDASSKQIADRLNQSIENYQTLQERLNEKEERILILASQSELSMKAQNTKLEQLHELSSLLVETRGKLADKESLTRELDAKVHSLNHQISQLEGRARGGSVSGNVSGVQVPVAGSSANDSDYTKLRIDLDTTKSDLAIAEKQAEEFSKIAKSAEDALIHSTNAFEEFRTEIESKRATLIAEKETMQSESVKLHQEVAGLKEELTKQRQDHTAEVERLTTELQEYSSKANAYDELQQDYEKKLATISEDLTNQVKFVADIQVKYQSELDRNDQLVSQVNNLRQQYTELDGKYAESNSSLESTKKELQRKVEMIEESQSAVNEELEKSKTKIEELQNQNNLLLNQIQLTEGTSEMRTDEGESNDNPSREVISYLRHEKDAAEAKLSAHLQEQSRLEQRLAATTLELESAKSDLRKALASTTSLGDINGEHEKLMEQLQQLNILRESNTTLRSENAENIKRVQKLTVELQVAQKQVPQLQEQLSNLSTDIAIKEQAVQLANEEVERYKTIVKEAGSASAEVDKAEHESLKLERDHAKSELETLKNSYGELTQKVDNSQKETEQLGVELTAMTERFNKLKGEAQEKLKRRSAEVKELRDNIEGLKTSLEKANQELSSRSSNDGQQNLQELEKKYQDAESNRVSLTKEKAELESRLANTVTLDAFNKLKSDYEQKLKQSSGGDVSEIKEKLEQEYRAKHDELYNSIKAKVEQESKEALDARVKEEVAKVGGTNNNVAELTKKFEDETASLKKEFEAELEKARLDTRKLTEKSTEIRVKMLNKKISKLTEQLNAQKNNAGAPSSLPTTPTLNVTPVGEERTSSPGSQKRPFTGNDANANNSNKKSK